LLLFKNHPNDFDVVVTDQTMPDMTGEALAKEILAIRPDIPIILTSGYSESINKQKAKNIGIREFAMKPLGIQDFAALLWQVLHSDNAVHTAG